MKTLNDQIEEMPEKVSLSVFDRIKALLASPDEKFTALQAQFDALTTKATQAEADLTTAKASLATLQARNAELEAGSKELGTANTDLKAKLATAEAAVTDFDGQVAAKTRELAAAQGLKAEQLPALPGGDTNPDKQKARAEEAYVALIRAGKSLEAGLYWEKNKALLS